MVEKSFVFNGSFQPPMVTRGWDPKNQILSLIMVVPFQNKIVCYIFSLLDILII